MADEEGVPSESTKFQVGDQLLDGWGNAVEEDTPSGTDYDSWTGKQLSAEVKRRNEGREDDAKISPEGKTKADFVAALEADDSEE